MRTPLGNNQPDKVRQSRLSTARATVSVRVFWPSNFHQRVRQKPVRPLEERAHVSSAVVGLQKVHILLNGISTRETRALAALIHKRQQVARCRNGCLCFAERPIAPVDQAVRRARLHFRGQRALAMLRASSVDLPRWCFPICQDGTHAHTHAPPPSQAPLRCAGSQHHCLPSLYGTLRGKPARMPVRGKRPQTSFLKHGHPPCP